VQGLLRKNSRERLTRPVVREALVRVLDEDADADRQPAPVPRLRAAYAGVRLAARQRGRTALAVGTALAVLTVAAAVLAATHGPTGPGAAQAPARTGVSAPSTGTATATPSPTASAPAALPAGYRRYTAPEGFSLALPDAWKRLTTTRVTGAYRVVFGRDGTSPTLAVTHSEHVGPDPVAIWRDDVEPGLRRLPGYGRVGGVRALTYQGHPAADLEWLAGSGAARVHTFGRGFLTGGDGFSLRFTTPATAWDDPANRLALTTFLRTFRAPAD
jgi:hypothetical protein